MYYPGPPALMGVSLPGLLPVPTAAAVKEKAPTDLGTGVGTNIGTGIRTGVTGTELTAEQKQEESQALSDKLLAGLKSITPTLLIVGVVTGAAFALGSGLVHRYVFKNK